eukprot:TRINITY_DN26847_c0_g1_i1.p2 TRINITY_DN26847_c0_g1~~TRINITY_DN26847_c0_g1_i1.p2  ORF type:complete len:396 (+),score=132.22 TRINITY_DN26847_c0_g1_i1:73-1188(+)
MAQGAPPPAAAVPSAAASDASNQDLAAAAALCDVALGPPADDSLLGYDPGELRGECLHLRHSVWSLEARLAAQSALSGSSHTDELRAALEEAKEVIKGLTKENALLRAEVTELRRSHCGGPGGGCLESPPRQQQQHDAGDMEETSPSGADARGCREASQLQQQQQESLEEQLRAERMRCAGLQHALSLLQRARQEDQRQLELCKKGSPAAPPAAQPPRDRAAGRSPPALRPRGSWAAAGAATWAPAGRASLSPRGDLLRRSPTHSRPVRSAWTQQHQSPRPAAPVTAGYGRERSLSPAATAQQRPRRASPSCGTLGGGQRGRRSPGARSRSPTGRSATCWAAPSNQQQQLQAKAPAPLAERAANCPLARGL